jgi:hypothetical protein
MSDSPQERQRQRVKQRYREETGRELPDHVVENLSVLTRAGTVDRREMMERVKEPSAAADENSSLIEGTIILLGWMGVSGIVGVYASRFFGGWPAPPPAGGFVAMFAAAVLAYGLFFLGIVEVEQSTDNQRWAAQGRKR